MKKYISGGMVALTMVACGGVKNTTNENIASGNRAVLPIGANDSVKGVSAPFTGFVEGRMLVGGGCNFPATPAAKGGAKEYYNDIYAYSAEEDSWERIGSFPKGLAYGASVVHGDEWICLGGNNNDGASVDVYSIRISGDTCTVDTLPSLPATMDNFAAVKSGNRIYVTGGNHNGQPRNEFFAFDLYQRNEWVRLADFPGPSRVQPLLLQGVNGGVLLMGGFKNGTLKEIPILSEKVYTYSPQEDVWREETTLPLSLETNHYPCAAGGFGLTLNDSTLLIGGGVNQSVFMQALDTDRQIAEAIQNGDTEYAEELTAAKKEYMNHPVEWYQFNPELYLYNIYTGQWTWLGAYPATAKAGAGIVSDGNFVYVIGGELKPGIRTDEVYALAISDLKSDLVSGGKADMLSEVQPEAAAEK